MTTATRGGRGRLRLLLSLLFAALFSSTAIADAPKIQQTPFACAKFTLCSAHTGTGACTIGGDVVVANLTGYQGFAAYFDQSVGSYSCDLVTASRGFDESSGVGVALNPAPITPATQPVGDLRRDLAPVGDLLGKPGLGHRDAARVLELAAIGTRRRTQHALASRTAQYRLGRRCASV